MKNQRRQGPNQTRSHVGWNAVKARTDCSIAVAQVQVSSIESEKSSIESEKSSIRSEKSSIESDNNFK